MAGDQANRVSIALQDIAALVDGWFTGAAGERLSFVLVVSVDGTAQYVSNTDRPGGVELLASLLGRMSAGRADIPAHYNPNLRPEMNPEPKTAVAGAPRDTVALSHECSPTAALQAIAQFYEARYPKDQDSDIGEMYRIAVNALKVAK